MVQAQQTITPQLTYAWPAATTTGQLGKWLIFPAQNASRPATYNVDWTDAGTAPSACTFNVQGSSDAVNWYALDGGTPVSCTTSGNEFIVDKPVVYLRINVVAFTGAGGTTTFHYTGARP